MKSWLPSLTACWAKADSMGRAGSEELTHGWRTRLSEENGMIDDMKDQGDFCVH
jgi:hypothetical protein